MNCCHCTLTFGQEGCEPFPFRPRIDISSVCKYFEVNSCKRCKKFRGGVCILGLNSPAECGVEFSRK